MSFNIVVIGINAKLTCFGNFQVIKLANNQIKPELTITIINEIQNNSVFFYHFDLIDTC